MSRLFAASRDFGRAINDRGDVVGDADTTAVDADGFPVFHAFSYERTGMHVDDPDGSVQVMISMSTLISFTTTDSNGERSATPQEVDLIPSDGAAFRIEGSPDCGAGVVSLTRNWPDQFDPRIRVTVVSVGNPGRTITVHHTDLEGASRTVPLPGGTSTPVFEGMTVGGHWVISSTLAINESCPGAEGSVVPDTTRVTAPTSLLASVSAICRNQ